MAKRTLFGILLLITMLGCFSSCDNEPYYDPYEVATDNLCSTSWLDEYETNDGRDCIQELIFNYDHTGYDVRTYFYPNGATQDERIPFEWDWEDGYTDALYIDYFDREESWLENIRFGNGTMKCLFDDIPVTFKASY